MNMANMEMATCTELCAEVEDLPSWNGRCAYSTLEGRLCPHRAQFRPAPCEDGWLRLCEGAYDMPSWNGRCVHSTLEGGLCPHRDEFRGAREGYFEEF